MISPYRLSCTLGWLAFSLVSACAGGHSGHVQSVAPRAEPAPLPQEGSSRELERVLARRLEARSPSRVEAALVIGAIDGTATAVVGRGQTAPDNPSTASEQTVFLVGSVTKVFTGLLLADAVTHRLVSPETSAQRLLPEIPIPTKEGLSPTLEQLATHTSGLPNMFENWTPSHEQFVELMRGCSLAAKPGEQVAYSNIGYALLGEAVARVWGQSYQDAIRTRITGPLGMSETGFMWTNPRSLRAQGYDEEWRPVPDDRNVPTLAPCCVLESSADDLLRLVRSYLGVAPKALLPALTFAAEPVVHGDEGWDYRVVASGWFLTIPDGYLTINGLMAGYRSSVYIDREGQRGVVVLANQSAFDTDALALEVLRDLARRRSPLELPTVAQVPADAIATKIAFEGGLRLVGYRFPRRVARGGRLSATLYFVRDEGQTEDLRVLVQGDAPNARHRLRADHYAPGTTDQWPPGKIVVDSIDVSVPADTDPGERQMYFGFYHGTRRMRVFAGCQKDDRACGPSLTVD